MNIPPIELSPDIIAYVSFIVSTMKRFMSPSMIQTLAPIAAVVAGGFLGYMSGGTPGIMNGIAAGLTTIGIYEGSKQGGKKIIKNIKGKP